MANTLSERMRIAYAEPLGNESESQYLLLEGARQIERLEEQVIRLKNDLLHAEELSRYWEAKVINMSGLLTLCGK